MEVCENEKQREKKKTIQAIEFEKKKKFRTQCLNYSEIFNAILNSSTQAIFSPSSLDHCKHTHLF